MEIIKSLVRELSPDDYRECYYLNYRSGGMMQEELGMCRTDRYDMRHLAYRIKPPGEQLLGWALVFFKYEAALTPDAYFYVRQSARCLGYGRAIRNAIATDFPIHRVHPHDHVSGEFFRATQPRTLEGAYV